MGAGHPEYGINTYPFHIFNDELAYLNFHTVITALKIVDSITTSVKNSPALMMAPVPSKSWNLPFSGGLFNLIHRRMFVVSREGYERWTLMGFSGEEIDKKAAESEKGGYKKICEHARKYSCVVRLLLV